jgi:hypothetical protein
MRKPKQQTPRESLVARYNWCQGPVPGRGPEVENHWSSVLKAVGYCGCDFIFLLKTRMANDLAFRDPIMPSGYCMHRQF